MTMMMKMMINVEQLHSDILHVPTLRITSVRLSLTVRLSVVSKWLHILSNSVSHCLLQQSFSFSVQ